MNREEHLDTEEAKEERGLNRNFGGGRHDHVQRDNLGHHDARHDELQDWEGVQVVDEVQEDLEVSVFSDGNLNPGAVQIS